MHACMCATAMHCTMRLFPVFLRVACCMLLLVWFCSVLFFFLFFPILQFDCGFQQIKFMAMAKRTKIPYLCSLKCQTESFLFLLFFIQLSFRICSVAPLHARQFCFFVTKNSTSSRHFSSYFGHLFCISLSAVTCIREKDDRFDRVDRKELKARQICRKEFWYLFGVGVFFSIWRCLSHEIGSHMHRDRKCGAIIFLFSFGSFQLLNALIICLFVR